MEIGTVRQVNIDDQMRNAYLDYAMSVIVSRALPDARDGLKPVHRRILYAMHEMGIRPIQPTANRPASSVRCSESIHPHSDQAVYDAMARMAQDFSMRYMLVDGQGNFGSIDGDPPAAMRYTEARTGAMAAELLVDIEKDTVDFSRQLRRITSGTDGPAGPASQPPVEWLGRVSRLAWRPIFHRTI